MCENISVSSVNFFYKFLDSKFSFLNDQVNNWLWLWLIFSHWSVPTPLYGPSAAAALLFVKPTTRVCSFSRGASYNCRMLQGAAQCIAAI